MRKNVLLLMSILMLLLVGCSKDEIDTFDYDINLLFGKWRVTHIATERGEYTDVTNKIAESIFEPTYITLSANGKYVGVGKFGDGNGTYKAKGNVVSIYNEGEKEAYLNFRFISLTDTNCEVAVFDDDSSAEFYLKCRKE